ncbi:hypothetical protein P175DRAFT_0380422 [Aspergillus ochraceoroseus IBT 24754]|uniref:Uncharacterized protein n=1 Tax=Aspergillus ochraceoroseus IBT 24754 TaxID=1392256 RepID=A0A2T5LNJ0_9EURO|nr:uncharacterized protein P175DRAFT_0380422 [Aspergillus ochraceoroseus IBT 24754]PTU17846.1 hypothetical protein P175DRAFT_0380422 [Aspergillus ochraceoroseus IBT 24754]
MADDSGGIITATTTTTTTSIFRTPSAFSPSPHLDYLGDPVSLRLSFSSLVRIPFPSFLPSSFLGIPPGRPPFTLHGRPAVHYTLLGLGILLGAIFCCLGFSRKL